MESRTQGSRPRPTPRTQKKNPKPRTALPRADTLEAKDRNARGQDLGPRTQKASLQKNFSGDLQKNGQQQNVFQPIYKILTIQKIVLPSRRGQGNFRGLEALRPRPRT